MSFYTNMRFQRDTLYWDDVATIKNDTEKSKQLLLNTIMKRCNISEKDLVDINDVTAKLRDFNIDEIIKIGEII